MRALWVALAALVASPASAQIATLDAGSDYYDWEYRFDFESAYQTGTTIDGGGSFDALRLRGRAGGGGPISQNVRLFMDVAYAHTGYDFGSPNPVACANAAACFQVAPWNDVNTVDVWAGASLVLNEAIQLQAIVPIRWQAESNSDENGVTAGVIGLVRIRLSESFVTGLGVGVQNEIEDDTRVFPVIALDWQILDFVRLATRGSPYQGADAVLTFGSPKGLQFRLASGWQRQRFRLSNTQPNPDGVGQYSAVPVLAGFRLNVGRRATVDLEGGVAVAGELLVENANGTTLDQRDFDTAGVIRGALRIVF